MLSKKRIRVYNGYPAQWSPRKLPDDGDFNKSYLVAAESTYLTRSQLEAGRKVVTRVVRRHKPRATFRLHPVFTVPYTKKATGSRMGKGKGSVQAYMCKLPENAILFEFHKIQKPVLMHLCNKVAQKLTIFLRYS